MQIESGLFDRMVVQRNRKNVSEAAFAGTTKSYGDVVATVKKDGEVQKNFAPAKVGTASGGKSE